MSTLLCTLHIYIICWWTGQECFGVSKVVHLCYQYALIPHRCPRAGPIHTVSTAWP